MESNVQFPLVCRHVAVILTVPGRDVLLRRALTSIRAQTRAPDRVILIADGNEVVEESTRHLAEAIVPGVEVLKNRRKKGLSGAVNTAMDHLLRTETRPEKNVLVSFLDDDDRWDNNYLATISLAARAFDGFFVGLLIRYDEITPEGRSIALPNRFSPEDFLVGNPGVQGSNLSVTLEKLLLSGGFDEALSSCTDRDLLIRLLDLGTPYRVVPNALVHHDTLHGTPRLSDPKNEQKQRGLDVFFAKYQWRMSANVREAFITRAQRLFGWTTPVEVENAATKAIALPTFARQSSPLHLVVGFIVDGHVPNRAKPLVDGLANLVRHPAIEKLDVVLLENGDAHGYTDVLEYAQMRDMRVWPVALADQAALAEKIGLAADDISRNKAIAIARTLLHRFVHEVARQTPNTIAWILDDDVRLTIDPDGLVDILTKLKATDFDVVIGSVSGAPPVPAATTSRTQLLDIASFLLAAAQHDPTDPLPDAEAINARWRIGRRDYYYDLARNETDRLETPFLPPLAATNVKQAIDELARRVPRIFAGEAVTRHVVPATGDVVTGAMPSHLRGGNTFVFKIDSLRDVANMSPRLNGRPVRRSDMLWAANSALRLGHKVVSAPFSLEQDRSADKPQNDLIRSVLDDILGYAFFRAYENVLNARAERSRNLLTPEEAQLILKRTRKYAFERFMSFRLSFWRARGLATVLRRCVFGDASFQPWWLDGDPHAETVNQWREFVSALEDRLSPVRLTQFEEAFANALENASFATFLAEQETRLFAPVTSQFPTMTQWYDQERMRRATTLAKQHLRREISEILGHGSEGVVMRMGDRVIKVFDGWNRSDRANFGSTLQTLVDAPRIAGLPEFVALHQWSDVIALETVYEPSVPYEGGRGPELFECLRSLVAAGWVHTNIEPKNLRVMASGVQIVDIGRSLQKSEPRLEECMIRRAFLSWRFAFRSDLSVLLRRTNTDRDFTELVGWRNLLAALRLEHPKLSLDKHIEERVQHLGATRLFDYGCGKPRSIHDWAATNGELEVFDPNDMLRARWSTTLPTVKFHDVVSLENSTTHFDVVVCALVLCTVDDSVAKDVLADLWRLVRPGGRVLVAVCDPISVRVQQTTHQIRLNTQNIAYHRSAPYEKRVGASCRHEQHRSLEAYRLMFARAGFLVANENTVNVIDIVRFEEVGEFVLLELAPLAPLPVRTSLLIKACAMEADTIEHQIKHLVRSLGTPRGFNEIVVVVDPFTGPFPRQYQSGDLPVLLQNLQDLQNTGFIDRIVEGPTDGDECRDIAMRWFGCEAIKAHAKNGQASLAFLKALDLCTGDLVLHADADVLVGRPNPDLDHLAETARLFESIPTVVTVALPVFGDHDSNVRIADDRGPYRVETQIGWLHRTRLLALQPLPNEVDDGQVELPWHRSLDRLVRNGKTLSVRRGSSGFGAQGAAGDPKPQMFNQGFGAQGAAGDPKPQMLNQGFGAKDAEGDLNPQMFNQGIWYHSPDNTRKVVLDELFMLLDRTEAGQAPAIQRHHSATMGTLAEWFTPKRTEEFVIVACGRNVGPGRINRFRDSLLCQTFTNWGAIVIDDASDDGTDEALRRVFADEKERMTLIHRRQRAGALANLVMAVKFFIERPDAVVVLVDLDDALGTQDALEKIVQAYEQGADTTIGTMIRTDKQVDYPVDFHGPRANRGGNVWQHVRTFRRYLFDRIDVADLQIDGAWIELASDWAFMLPIVEMAENPIWIRTPLYLHEPGETRDPEHRAQRERVISTLVSRPRYARFSQRKLESEEKS